MNADSGDETPIVEIDDLLESINQSIEIERENCKRTILPDVEARIDTLFDDIELNIADFLKNSIPFHEDEIGAEIATRGKVEDTFDADDHIEMIEIDEDSVGEDSDGDDSQQPVSNKSTATRVIAAAAAATATTPATSTSLGVSKTSKSGDSKRKKAQKWPAISVPKDIRKKFPVFIKVFDTSDDANRYRINDNFRYPMKRSWNNGVRTIYTCYNYFQCKTRFCIWQLNGDKRCYGFRSDIPHNHKASASKTKISDQTINEIQTLWNRGMKAPKSIFDTLCDKHGLDSVNGFDVIRCIMRIRDHEQYKKKKKERKN